MLVVELKRGEHYFRCFGLLPCGKFGKKKTTESSRQKSAPFYKWWIRSRHFPMSGWRQNWPLLH